MPVDMYVNYERQLRNGKVKYKPRKQYSQEEWKDFLNWPYKGWEYKRKIASLCPKRIKGYKRGYKEHYRECRIHNWLN